MMSVTPLAGRDIRRRAAALLQGLHPLVDFSAIEEVVSWMMCDLIEGQTILEYIFRFMYFFQCEWRHLKSGNHHSW